MHVVWNSSHLSARCSRTTLGSSISKPRTQSDLQIFTSKSAGEFKFSPWLSRVWSYFSSRTSDLSQTFGVKWQIHGFRPQLYRAAAVCFKSLSTDYIITRDKPQPQKAKCTIQISHSAGLSKNSFSLSPPPHPPKKKTLHSSVSFIFLTPPNWVMAFPKHNLCYTSDCVVSVVNAKAISFSRLPKFSLS